ncbi:MAG: PTS sugar transporter subunit IIA [Opitutales bacterium]|nr:PTS sugar transporter subunit IIA [Opitutales bacterium]
MRLDKFVTRGRTIDLESTDLKGALRELLEVSTTRFKDLKPEKLLKEFLEREKSMTTYLGNGVAMPHIRVKMPRRYVFAIGRSKEGLQYDSLQDGEKVHLVIMLIAGEDEKDYLKVLASIARVLKNEEFVESLVSAPTEDVFYDRMFQGVGGVLAKPIKVQQNRINKLMFRQAEKIAKGADCSCIVVFADTLNSGLEMPRWFPGFRTILVAGALTDVVVDQKQVTSSIQVRSLSRQRLSQLRSAVLVGMTRGEIEYHDRLCCIAGIPGSNQFDTVTVVDVDREFQILFNENANILPKDVKPEILERILAVATELAVEGREGHPVGALFVLGDHEKVTKMSKALVMNPFHGYSAEDRNVLNPFLHETLKEFSLIDGAFIIQGDGVAVSAGALIHAPDYYHNLPSGLGSRHAAASAVSMAADCIAIVVSSSTGQVTLFRAGSMLPLFEKSSSSF